MYKYGRIVFTDLVTGVPVRSLHRRGFDDPYTMDSHVRIVNFGYPTYAACGRVNPTFLRMCVLMDHDRARKIGDVISVGKN